MFQLLQIVAQTLVAMVEGVGLHSGEIVLGLQNLVEIIAVTVLSLCFSVGNHLVCKGEVSVSKGIGAALKIFRVKKCL